MLVFRAVTRYGTTWGEVRQLPYTWALVEGVGIVMGRLGAHRLSDWLLGASNSRERLITTVALDSYHVEDLYKKGDAAC